MRVKLVNFPFQDHSKIVLQQLCSSGRLLQSCWRTFRDNDKMGNLFHLINVVTAVNLIKTIEAGILQPFDSLTIEHFEIYICITVYVSMNVEYSGIMTSGIGVQVLWTHSKF